MNFLTSFSCTIPSWYIPQISQQFKPNHPLDNNVCTIHRTSGHVIRTKCQPTPHNYTIPTTHSPRHADKCHTFSHSLGWFFLKSQIWHKLIKKGKNWRKLRLAWIFFIVKNPPANFLPWHSSDWRNPEPTIFCGVAMLKADHWWLCLIVTLVLSVWLFTEDRVPQKE